MFLIMLRQEAAEVNKEGIMLHKLMDMQVFFYAGTRVRRKVTG